MGGVCYPHNQPCNEANQTKPYSNMLEPSTVFMTHIDKSFFNWLSTVEEKKLTKTSNRDEKGKVSKGRPMKRKSKERASMALFLSFVKHFKDGSISSKPILGKSCYETWLKSRKGHLKCPEEAFRKAVTAHVKGSDGRRPFPPLIEAQLINILRKRKVWECFKGGERRIGERGCYVKGFWETEAARKTWNARQYIHYKQLQQSRGIKRKACDHLASFLEGKLSPDEEYRQHNLEINHTNQNIIKKHTALLTPASLEESYLIPYTQKKDVDYSSHPRAIEDPLFCWE